MNRIPLNDHNALSAIEIKPSVAPQRSVIWLHGLGADGNDFVPIVPELALPESLAIHYVFPHAPVIPVTINNRFAMRAWYDIRSPALDADIDVDGIEKSTQWVEQLIALENQQGVPAENILLAGFSQGAVIALTTALKSTHKLAGVIALSGYLPFADQLTKAATANLVLPIFQAHGMQDPIVPYPIAKASAETLKQAGFPVEWHIYPMGHTVCLPEIKDLSAWIKEIWS